MLSDAMFQVWYDWYDMIMNYKFKFLVDAFVWLSLQPIIVDATLCTKLYLYIIGNTLSYHKPHRPTTSK